MPIASRKYSNECRRKIHRINTSFSNQVSQGMLDEYINESYRAWFRNLTAKFEINSETRNDLRIFEKKDQLLSFTNKEDKVIANIPKDFYKLTNQIVIGEVPCEESETQDCSGCKRPINIRILQSGEIRDALKDPYWRPSFEWGETIGDESSEGLHIWHSDKFIIKQVVVDYIREPKEFRNPSAYKEGFYTIGNEVFDKDLPMELDEIRAHEVSDLVALFIARDLSDSQEYQSQIDKIIKKDTLYLN